MTEQNEMVMGESVTKPVEARKPIEPGVMGGKVIDVDSPSHKLEVAADKVNDAIGFYAKGENPVDTGTKVDETLRSKKPAKA